MRDIFVEGSHICLRCWYNKAKLLQGCTFIQSTLLSVDLLLQLKE
jgi:hypothetical protein